MCLRELSYHSPSMLILFFMYVISISSSFRLTIRSGVNIKQNSLKLNGYVQPERDPEYRNVIKKSLLLDPIGTILNENDTLPIPKEGDVVLCPSSWSKDTGLGLIRYLRESVSSNNETTWTADVGILKEGKSQNVFVIDKSLKPITTSTDNLKPVKFFYLRSENGYKISYKENSTVAILRAPRYKAIDKSIQLIKKSINTDTLENDMNSYEILKTRLQQSTFQLGAVIAGVLLIASGFENSATYFAGVCFSVAYLFLLGKETDTIGIDYSRRSNKNSKTLIEKFAKVRFLLPALLLIGFAGINRFSNSEWKPFQIVTKMQYIYAISGFLTYRVSIFLSEVIPEMRIDDLLGILPGSVAEGLRQLRNIDKDGSNLLIKRFSVVLVTGPKAAGRTPIVDQLVLKFKSSSAVINRWKFISTDWKLSQQYPWRFDYIDEATLDDLKEGKSIVFEGFEEGSKIYLSSVTLSPDSLYVLDGPPSLVESLNKLDNLDLTSIWLTVQSKEEVRKGAFKLSASESDELVNDAIQDIIKFKDLSTLFKYTIMSSWTRDEDSLFELENIMKQLLVSKSLNTS